VEIGINPEDWENLHPEQAAAYLKAWERKQAREDTRLAELKYYLVQPHSKKRFKITDFLPAYAKPKEDPESKLKAQLMAMAAKSKQNGKL
jgi:hypothetical protein